MPMFPVRFSIVDMRMCLSFEVVAEVEGGGAFLFAASFVPTAAAEGYVFVVSSDFYLVAVGHHVSVGIDTGIDDGFSSAGAGGFHLVDGIGYFKKPS